MRDAWLLSDETYSAYVAQYEGFEFDASAYEAFIERTSQTAPGSELFHRAEGVAHIPVVGTLSKQPNFFFDIFGGGSTVYGDLIRSIEAADADPDVTEIRLEIDSPGGSVAGFFDASRAIIDTETRIVAHVTDLAASAAYGLAASTDEIIVNNSMAMLGSIGVVQRHFVDDSVVRITSTAAPNKAPTASTPEGVKAVRRELDDIHAEFAGIIAQGRGVSVQDVNDEYGRGGIVLARVALQAGMIDGIAGMEKLISGGGSAGASSAQQGIEIMDLTELKQKHPDVFAAAHAEGHTAGVAQERDRVTAHVRMAASHNAPEAAVGFILDGSDLSGQTVTATYLSAGMTSREMAAREGDDESLELGPPPASENDADAAASRNAETVFSQVLADRGITAKEV